MQRVFTFRFQTILQSKLSFIRRKKNNVIIYIGKYSTALMTTLKNINQGWNVDKVKKNYLINQGFTSCKILHPCIETHQSPISVKIQLVFRGKTLTNTRSNSTDTRMRFLREEWERAHSVRKREILSQRKPNTAFCLPLSS